MPGLLVRAAQGLLPQRAGIPIAPTQWPAAQMPGGGAGFQTFARAYASNEIVFSSIELLATSAAEPKISGQRMRRASPQVQSQRTILQSKGLTTAVVNARLVRDGFVEMTPNHPAVRLVNNPNKYTSRGQMWASAVMDLKLAGNCFLLKARYENGHPLAGAVAELWRLRPDRVRIIPDSQQFCRYEYRIGNAVMTFDYNDVMHFKTRNPFDEFYGMPPMMTIMERIQIDRYMRGFLKTFFERGGTGPASILTVKQKMKDDDKELLRARFRGQFGGPGGWHEMAIIDGAESSYQSLGLNRGLRDALPKEIDAQTEARMAMIFGIPGSILGLLIGYESSSYANKRQDWQVLWDVTMAPMLSDMDDVMNLSLIQSGDFPSGVDEINFDLSDIKALQEDVDALWTRYLNALDKGGIVIEEFRDKVGLDPILSEGHYLIPVHKLVVPADELDNAATLVSPAIPTPPPNQLEPGSPPMNIIPVASCERCARYLGRDIPDTARIYCPRCKVEVGVR